MVVVFRMRDVVFLVQNLSNATAIVWCVGFVLVPLSLGAVIAAQSMLEDWVELSEVSPAELAVRLLQLQTS